MTPTEMENALARMDDEAFTEFRRRFGGDYTTRAQYVQHFVANPVHEHQLAFLLGCRTEDEKLVAAAELSASAANRSAAASEQSAEASVSSASSARWSMIWAGLAVIVSLVALALAAYSN